MQIFTHCKILFANVYFQFTIKPVDKKAPDFVFFSPKIRINKLVNIKSYPLFQLAKLQIYAVVEQFHQGNMKVCIGRMRSYPLF